ncbi:RNA polymerase subunit sigma-70 [Serratia marcescens]|uniref:RNA polymerase subunit sigma-70 n=1 Tax=Serratia proteamaculans TaxID=28151 RepID=A0A7U0N6K4_SERPR|nr:MULTISPECIES: RNA polymerase subunit sigma-70 [Serratia]MBN5198758.1 RNA polymerase subunit sigma-70 [Serratia marcescens]MBH2810157.1 RNA polymerase subunit sigma-70 [Serratia liquefaciens]MBO1502142.1 RNA polymerase subunit sigma-70 [Serratia proteamaculans]MDW5510447.1 RNA polymerase subunit sigma-70 [Serratia proteamaculans]QQX53308.1 RNA polymerase subunit sigma-70 [Serratia proteamaculans]
MNQSDFAKLHGVSRKTVTSWKARGWLVLAGDDIDVEASNANIERFRKTVTRPEKKAAGNKQGNKTGNRSSGNKSGNKNDKDLPESATKTVERMIAEHGVTMTLDEARQMKENFLALLTQLEYDIKSGQVLPYKDMIEAVGNEYARMRTRLIAIAPEHGPRLRVLASTTNDAEFVQALQEVVYEAMEELSLDADNNRGEN